MSEPLAEIGVPRVEVGVEVHQGEGTVPFRRGPEQREGNGVVAADGDQPTTPGQQRTGGLFNLRHRRGDVEG